MQQCKTHQTSSSSTTASNGSSTTISPTASSNGSRPCCSPSRPGKSTIPSLQQAAQYTSSRGRSYNVLKMDQLKKIATTAERSSSSYKRCSTFSVSDNTTIQTSGRREARQRAAEQATDNKRQKRS